MWRLTLGGVGWPHGTAVRRGGWMAKVRRLLTFKPSRDRGTETVSESNGHGTAEPSAVGLPRADGTEEGSEDWPELTAQDSSASQSVDERGAPSSGSNGSDTVRDNGFVPERNAGRPDGVPVSRETHAVEPEATSTIDMARFTGRAAAPLRASTATPDQLPPPPSQRTGTIYGRAAAPAPTGPAPSVPAPAGASSATASAVTSMPSELASPGGERAAGGPPAPNAGPSMHGRPV